MRNFVWDKTDKKLISIDHESFLENRQSTKRNLSKKTSLSDAIKALLVVKLVHKSKIDCEMVSVT